MTYARTYPHKMMAFLLGVFLFLLTAFAILQADAQTLSGRSVDTTAINGQQQSCQLPALRLRQRIIILRQSIEDILACNAQGGLFQSDGTCRLAVLPDHDYRDPAPAEPEGRSGLSFTDLNGNFSIYGIIGGIDGDDVSCRRNNCTPDSEERTLTCPDGTVIVVETRQFICPDGIWTAWEPTGNTCDGPRQCVYNGVTYDEGETFTLFAQGEECETCDQQNFTCTAGGTITPDPADYPNYIYTTQNACLASNPCDGAQCFFGGQLYEDGEGFTLYSNQGLACDNCNDQNFVCDNGIISPPLSGYPTYTYTTEASCLADNTCGACNLPPEQGGTLGHGQSRTLFAPRPYGQCSGGCATVTVSCVNGQISNNYNANLRLTCPNVSPQTEPFCYCEKSNIYWPVGGIRHFIGPGDGEFLKCCEGILLPGLPHGLFVDVSNDGNSGGGDSTGGGTDEHCK